MLNNYMKMALMGTSYTKDMCSVDVLYPDIKNGPAYLKRLTYTFGDMVVSFCIWYIKNYNRAYKKHIRHIELHNQLYGALEAYSKKLGHCSFNGDEGQQIVNKILKKTYISPQVQITQQNQR